MTLEERLVEIVKAAPQRMPVFKAVSTLNLPDCFVAGGFIRNAVWDSLYDTEDVANINDVDVVYFKSLDAYGIDVSVLVEQIRANQMNPVWEEENRAQEVLAAKIPGVLFEVKNQARMHLSLLRTFSHEPYTSLYDALADWVETVTPIGVKLNTDGSFSVIAPCGLEDLFGGVVRPTRKEHVERLHERAVAKGWFERWPKLRFEPCK